MVNGGADRGGAGVIGTGVIDNAGRADHSAGENGVAAYRSIEKAGGDRRIDDDGESRADAGIHRAIDFAIEHFRRSRTGADQFATVGGVSRSKANRSSTQHGSGATWGRRQ